VLAEMHGIDLAATELGPDGWLAQGSNRAIRDVLDAHELRLVGGFVCATLHRRDRHEKEIEAVRKQAQHIADAGGDVLVLSIVGGSAGYDEVLQLDDGEWNAVFDGIERCVDVAREVNLECVVHPHIGTTIETREQVMRLLAGSDVRICLDTGHLMIGGTDPVALAREHPDRIGHVHLKDVRADLADRVRTGELSYSDGVTEGLYVPVGKGDVDIATVVECLESAGFNGWYVLEQDVRLTSLDADPSKDAALSAETIRRWAGTAVAEPAG
jgi:inosose dehydratase